MADPAMQEKFDTIRARHRRASAGWIFVTDRRDEFLAAKLVPNLPAANIVMLTENCGYEDRDFLLHAWEDINDLFGICAQSFRTIRELKQQLADRQARSVEAEKSEETANYAAECAMKCAEPAFLAFLREQYGFDTSDSERVAVQIRGALLVGSRADLNTDPAAAGRWKDMRASFKAWEIHA